MKVKSIRGFKDILPEEIKRWHFIEEKAKSVFEKFGFSEIRIPVLESTKIYTSGLGGTSDIVEKEMYTFEDRDVTSITLRPEGTAGVVRSFIENSMHIKSPLNKLYYNGTMFRHERPQKGRYRGFNQIGAECFGSGSPYCDAEVISMLWAVFDSIVLTTHVNLEINSIGTNEDRAKFRTELINFFEPQKDNICEDCKRKLDGNPLRILDCKNKDCVQIIDNAPSILDFLSEESRDHFENVKLLLEKIKIPFIVNPRIVRGLDYYTDTVFELTTDKLGSQNAVAAGGRYDVLVKQLGGPDTPAVGFAIGLERLILLHEQVFPEVYKNRIDIYIACLGDEAQKKGIYLSNILRKQGFNVEFGYDNKSLKSQLKRADKLEAEYTIILGESELQRSIFKLKNMKLSEENEYPLDQIENFKDLI
ncbi:MAG: histidine--tRNA ligase [Thermodesulfobacteriota bacterium]